MHAAARISCPSLGMVLLFRGLLEHDPLSVAIKFVEESGTLVSPW
jgi:hypothetical protein